MVSASRSGSWHEGNLGFVSFGFRGATMKRLILGNSSAAEECAYQVGPRDRPADRVKC